MSFVTPALLLGVALVAIPIALHLLMRRQPTRFEFPALRLVRERSEANRRRFRLRHLLLLLLRCAAIALLALALARPSILGTGVLGGREAPVAAGLVFDTSMRMDYRQQNQSRLDKAREMALWLAAQLPNDSRLAVFTSHSESGAFAPTRSAARQQIERLRVGAIARPLVDLIAEAVELIRQSELTRKEVYVLTDLCQAAWTRGDATRLRGLLSKAEDVNLYVIDVGSNEIRNVGLGEPRLSADQLLANRPLRIDCDLVASEPSGDRQVVLEFPDSQSDRKWRKYRQALVSWQDGQPGQAVFQLADLDQGLHQGRVRIVGQDALAADDERVFTVYVTAARPVLIAASAGADALYLDQALTAWGFESHVVPLDQLAQQTLSDYAAVFLLDPPTLPEAQWRRLQLHAQGGGGVAVLLGRHAQREAMNQPAAQEVLPGRLERYGRDARYLAPAMYQHPALRQLGQYEAVPWSDFPVMTYWQLGPLHDGIQAIIPFDNGQPALLEQTLGQGRVLTMTTPVSDPPNVPGRAPWNLLPTGEDPWPFLVLMGEVTAYLSGGADARLNYLAGQAAVVPLPRGDRPPMVLLSTPRGDTLRQAVDPASDSIVVTTTDAVGNYLIRSGGGAQRIRRGFSVNLPGDISRLERIAEDDLTSLLGQGAFRLARTHRQLENRVSDARVGWNLFPFLMLLLAVVLACEHLLSNRFYQEPAEQ